MNGSCRSAYIARYAPSLALSDVQKVRTPAPTIGAAGRAIVNEMPPLRSPDDRFTAIARLRVVMEDSTQLLSNSVAYIIDQLCTCGNRPSEVFIPGFTNVIYPKRQPTLTTVASMQDSP
jgi:hypothetical protein